MNCPAIRHLLAAGLLLALSSPYASAQAQAQTPAPAPGSAAPAQSAQPRPALSVSGTIHGNYNYLLGGPREDFNQFAIDRVYVNIRGPVAPRTTFRVTSDVYQSGDGNGWTVRMKYAFLDYVLRQGAWATSLRGGILQTVTIEQQQEYWPRWLGPVAIDRHGFFRSADAGVSLTTRLPSGLGEVLGHVVNGPGYTRRETDRFKDVGARVTLTPFGGRESGLLRSLALTGWRYEGATASATGDALQRDRWGVHAGVNAPRFVAAVDHSRRTDETETVVPVAPGAPGAPVQPIAPGVVATRDAAVTSAFTIVRPLSRPDGKPNPSLGLIGRYDLVTPRHMDADGYHYLLAGAIVTVHSRLALSLNYQEQLGHDAPSPFRGAFLNVVLDF